MFYGSIVIAGLVLVAYCARARLRMLPLLDLFAVVVPVGQAFGRVGCFLNGCCYGRPADTWLSVRYPALSIPWHDQVNAGLLPAGAPASLPMLPSQLIEAAGCALLFLLLLWAYRRLNPSGVPVAERPAPGARDPAGAALAIYLAGYGVLRFIVETLRSDERAHPFGGPFTISQAISLGALLLAAALFARIWLRNRPSARACAPAAAPLVPAAGVEPARPCGQGMLSPLRLPFRHAGAPGRRQGHYHKPEPK